MANMVEVFSPCRRPEARGGRVSSSRTRGSTRSIIGCRFELCGQLRDESFPDRVGVHGLGQDLEGKEVVVAVDNEPREEVGFAEDDAIGVGVRDDPFAVGDGIGNMLAEQERESR